MTKNLVVLVSLVLSTVLSSVAMAEVKYSMPSIEGGFKWNSMDGTDSSANKQSLGYQFGGSIVFDFSELVSLKTGLMYSERTFKFDTVLGDVSGKMTYADIPFHFMFKVEDYAGIYIGPTLSTKIGDEISAGSKLSGVKAMIIPITFGGQFKFTELLGVNLFFETVPGDLASGITGSRGIGANLMIAF